MEEQSQIYLDQYLSSLSETERKKYQSFGSDYFCADERNANLCAELIRIGQKTATCSLNIWYESAKNQCQPLVIYKWSLIGMGNQFVSLKLIQLKRVNITKLRLILLMQKARATVH